MSQVRFLLVCIRGSILIALNVGSGLCLVLVNVFFFFFNLYILMLSYLSLTDCKHVTNVKQQCRSEINLPTRGTTRASTNPRTTEDSI